MRGPTFRNSWASQSDGPSLTEQIGGRLLPTVCQNSPWWTLLT